jgi:hypothetical protein
VLGQYLVNETHFEYIRDRDNQLPQNTTPTVTVQGAFTGGGNNDGTVRDNQDHYELQDYVTMARGPHSIRFGARLRAIRDANYSTAGSMATSLMRLWPPMPQDNPRNTA